MIWLLIKKSTTLSVIDEAMENQRVKENVCNANNTSSFGEIDVVAEAIVFNVNGIINILVIICKKKYIPK